MLSLSHYSLDSIASAAPTTLSLLHALIITATVANPHSLQSWPPHQPSIPFSAAAAAATAPDHSFSAGISAPPDFMLGVRNILILPPPPPPPQIITHPSPSPVNFTDKARNHNAEEKACRDCGNRAKKECLFERCRTCCKSRGYRCATHVKSTWIPSSHHQSATRSSSSSSDRKNKKLKLDASHKPNPAATVSIVPTTTPRQERSFKEGLPGKIEAPAVFRRMRVTAISNNEQAEIGYQATVTISGHVFKGFLHYYGVDHNKAFPCISKN